MQQHQTSSTKHSNITGPIQTIWILNNIYHTTNRWNIRYSWNFVVLTILHCCRFTAATTVLCCSACNIAAFTLEFSVKNRSFWSNLHIIFCKIKSIKVLLSTSTTLLVLLRFLMQVFWCKLLRLLCHQPIAASITAALSQVDNHIASIPFGYKSNKNVAKYLEQYLSP